MSFYTRSVVVSPQVNGWRLASTLKWEIGKEGSGHVYQVNPGFVTDLASVPWWGRWLVNPANPALAKAAILHDAMLSDPEYSRITAAAEFSEALRADGVARWRCILMGLAVLTQRQPS